MCTSLVWMLLWYTSLRIQLLLFMLFTYCCGCLFFFQAEDGIRDGHVTGVQTCALPIFKIFKRFSDVRHIVFPVVFVFDRKMTFESLPLHFVHDATDITHSDSPGNIVCIPYPKFI